MNTNPTLAEIAAELQFKNGDYKGAMRTVETNPTGAAESYFGVRIWNAANVILRHHRIVNARQSLSEERRDKLKDRALRITGILDLGMSPWTIGDTLNFNQVLLTIRELEGADKIDMVWICDQSKPGRWDQGISQKNTWHYMADLIPLVRINPYLGSFHIFDNRDIAEEHILNAATYSIVCPLYNHPKTRAIEGYAQHIPFLFDVVKNIGDLPSLRCRQDTKARVRQIIRSQQALEDRTLIAVHLRKSTYWVRRNFREEAWVPFFEYCAKQYPQFAFLLIGAKKGGFPELAGLDNIQFVKDWGTSSEQDMALIQETAAFIGNTAGPIVMAIHSHLPYRIFGYEPVIERALVKTGDQYPWRRSNQQLFWENETLETLTAAFEEMISHIDATKWLADFRGTENTDKATLSRTSPQFGSITDLTQA